VRVLAADLGATSVRVAEVDLDASPIRPRVVHRWPHGPVEHPDGTLRWDWTGIVREIRRGLDAALDEGPAASIGVDGWGVDYGLLDSDGRLVSPPFSYRDPRTAGWGAVADRIGRDRLYATTGIQLMAINTVFQLAAHDPRELDRAELLLLLPDLLVHELTGYVGAERSNASTTALLDTRAGDWTQWLPQEVGVPPELLPDVRAATEMAGTYRGVPVHLVGSHDTASAFVAVPGIPGPGTAVVSSGTWVLVGAERAEPDTSEAARRANFSNELGALGGVRFLKNVVGLWLLERCRAQWGSPPVAELVAAAAEVSLPVGVVDATDERFLSPADMEAEVRAAAGLPSTASRAVVTRTVLESIAVSVARVVDELSGFIGRAVEEVFVVGGGARVSLLNELFGAHTGVPVRVGSAEATALGNAVVQGTATGYFPDLGSARAALAASAAGVRERG
jgi:rhamnulokinase